MTIESAEETETEIIWFIELISSRLSIQPHFRVDETFFRLEV